MKNTKTYYQRYLVIAEFLISELGEEELTEKVKEVQGKLAQIDSYPGCAEKYSHPSSPNANTFANGDTASDSAHRHLANGYTASDADRRHLHLRQLPHSSQQRLRNRSPPRW